MTVDRTKLQAELAELGEEYPFTGKLFDTGHGLMHYLDEGTGPVLVMVHGNPTWSFFWRKLVKAFRGNHRIIVPDHLGCGLSDKPQDWDYTLDNHARNLEALLKHLGVDKATLLVHDWGGSIGNLWAARNPSKVSGLVAMNTAAFRSSLMPWPIGLCRIPFFGKLAIRGFNAFAWAATRTTTVKPLPAAIRRGFLIPYRSWEERIATHQFVVDIPRQEGDRSWAALIETERGLNQYLNKPVLLPWGMADWCFCPRFLAEWQRHLPQAELHKFEAGHYLMEDQGEQVEACIRQFLTKHRL